MNFNVCYVGSNYDTENRSCWHCKLILWTLFNHYNPRWKTTVSFSPTWPCLISHMSIFICCCHFLIQSQDWLACCHAWVWTVLSDLGLSKKSMAYHHSNHTAQDIWQKNMSIYSMTYFPPEIFSSPLSMEFLHRLFGQKLGLLSYPKMHYLTVSKWVDGWRNRLYFAQ